MSVEILEAQAMPLPEQMFEIARVAVCLAKDQDKLRANSRADNSHFFIPEQVERYEVVDNDQCHSMMHRFTGRIAKIGYRQWTMFIAEPTWCTSPVEVEKEESYDTEVIYINDGFRITYAFNWDAKQVKRAEKHIRPIDPLTKHSRIVEQIPANDIPEPLSVEELVLQKTFDTMSQDDCNMLIADLEHFSKASKKKESIPKYYGADDIFNDQILWDRLKKN